MKQKEKKIFIILSAPFFSAFFPFFCEHLYVPFLWLNTFESVIFCVRTVCLTSFTTQRFFWGSYDLWFERFHVAENGIFSSRFSQFFLVTFFENFLIDTEQFLMRKHINQSLSSQSTHVEACLFSWNCVKPFCQLYYITGSTSTMSSYFLTLLCSWIPKQMSYDSLRTWSFN